MKYINLSFLSLIILSSCSHYDAPELQPVREKTYTGKALILYYNGMEMPNKSVTLTQNGDQASAKLFSEFDLNQLSALGLSGEIAAPGVFPGEVSSTISLDMKPDTEYWNFSGNGSNESCTFNYAGYANNEKMALFLSDVKLKTPGITPSIWKPAPITMNDGIYTSLPFYINWQYDPIPGIDFNLSPYLEALATLPIIPVYNNTAYMSISQAVSLMLQSLAFKDDGNIIISYISSIGGASRLAQTLPNRYMYTVESPKQIKLYVNPTALFGMILVATSPGTPVEDVKIIGNGIYPSGNVTTSSPSTMEGLLKSDVIKKFAKATLSVLLPQCAQGIPVAVSEENNNLYLYIDTQMATDLLQTIVTPLLSDSETIKAIVEYIESDPDLKPLLPEINKAMELIPQAIAQTNDFQLGLALVPYQQQ